MDDLRRFFGKAVSWGESPQEDELKKKKQEKVSDEAVFYWEDRPDRRLVRQTSSAPAMSTKPRNRVQKRKNKTLGALFLE